MPEEVLFKSEQRMSRAQIADYLRTVADNLDDGKPITLSAGSDSQTMEVPSQPTFEVKAEREDGHELSIEFELEWEEGQNGGEGGDGSLTIE